MHIFFCAYFAFSRARLKEQMQMRLFLNEVACIDGAFHLRGLAFFKPIAEFISHCVNFLFPICCTFLHPFAGPFRRRLLRRKRHNRVALPSLMRWQRRDYPSNDRCLQNRCRCTRSQTGPNLGLRPCSRGTLLQLRSTILPLSCAVRRPQSRVLTTPTRHTLPCLDRTVCSCKRVVARRGGNGN